MITPADRDAYKLRTKTSIRDKIQKHTVLRSDVANRLDELVDMIFDLSGPDGLIAVGGLVLSGNTLNILPDVLWQIDQELFEIIVPTEFTINFAAVDNYRIDLIYADKFGNLNLISGVESEDTAVPPALPNGTIPVTYVNIFGDQIDQPNPEIDLSNYVTFDYANSHFIFANPTEPQHAFAKLVGSLDTDVTVYTSNGVFFEYNGATQAQVSFSNNTTRISTDTFYLGTYPKPNIVFINAEGIKLTENLEGKDVNLVGHIGIIDDVASNDSLSVLSIGIDYSYSSGLQSRIRFGNNSFGMYAPYSINMMPISGDNVGLKFDLNSETISRITDNAKVLFEGDLDGAYILASPVSPQVASINIDGNITSGNQHYFGEAGLLDYDLATDTIRLYNQNSTNILLYAVDVEVRNRLHGTVYYEADDNNDFVQLGRLATGKVIGANTTGSASKWDSALANFGAFATGTVTWIPALETESNIVKPFQAPALRNFIGVNTGKVIDIYEGDSITAPASQIGNDDNWPYQLIKIDPDIKAIEKYNVALGGDTVANYIASGQYNSQVYPHRPINSYDVSRLYFRFGINDLGFDTPEAVYANLKTAWAQARVDGFTVIAFTLTPINDPIYSPKKDALNVLIRSDRTLYDALADSALTFDNLGIPPGNPGYFLDHVHPNAAGSMLIAKDVLKALNGIGWNDIIDADTNGNARLWGAQLFTGGAGGLANNFIGFNGTTWTNISLDNTKISLGIPVGGETLQSVADRNGRSDTAITIGNNQPLLFAGSGTATWSFANNESQGDELWINNTAVSAIKIKQNGYTGILTTPTEALDVNGAVKVRSTTTTNTAASAALDFSPSDNSARFLSFGTDASTYGGFKLLSLTSTGVNRTPFQIDSAGDSYFSGKVGINIGVATEALDVNGNIKARGDFRTGTNLAYGKFTHNSNHDQLVLHAFDDYSITTAIADGQGYASFDASHTLSGGFNHDHIIGFQARQRYAGTGAITGNLGMTGFYARTEHVGTGTVTNAVGIWLEDIAGTGPVTQSIGLLINPITRGSSSNYAIYTNSGEARFGDLVSSNGATAGFSFTDRSDTSKVWSMYADADFAKIKTPSGASPVQISNVGDIYTSGKLGAIAFASVAADLPVVTDGSGFLKVGTAGGGGDLESVLAAGNHANSSIVLADFYTDDTDYQGLEFRASSGYSEWRNVYGGNMTNRIRLHPSNGSDLTFYNVIGNGTVSVAPSLDNSKVVVNCTDGIGGFLNVRVAAPVDDDDAINKAYATLDAITTIGNYTDNAIQIQGADNADITKDGMILYNAAGVGAYMYNVKSSIIKGAVGISEAGGLTLSGSNGGLYPLTIKSVSDAVSLVADFAGRIKIVAPEYADNAAAITGGLIIGELYRTGDVVKVVN